VIAFLICYILVNLNLGVEVPEDDMTPKQVEIVFVYVYVISAFVGAR